MENDQITYEDGAVIFREGDPAEGAFEVIAGAVDVSILNASGFKNLALLQPGDIFDALEESNLGVRSATATAMGAVTLRKVKSHHLAGGGFFDKIISFFAPPSSHPENNKAPENDKTIESAQTLPAVIQESLPHKNELTQSIFPPMSFFSRLFARAKSEPGIDVRLMVFAETKTESVIANVIAALISRPRMNIKNLKPGSKYSADIPFADFISNISTPLRRELNVQGADLVICIHAPDIGDMMELALLSALPWADEITEMEEKSFVVPFPTDFGPEMADFLYLLALQHVNPATAFKTAVIDDSFPGAAAALSDKLEPRLAEVPPRERADQLRFLGNALSKLAKLRPEADLSELGLAQYESALLIYTEEETPAEWGACHYHIGRLLQDRAEVLGSTTEMLEIIGSFEKALGVLQKENQPAAWAALHFKLGTLYYRLDVNSNDQEMIKKSLTHYQDALKVYSRSKTRQKWIETRNGYGQSALLLGTYVKSPEALASAVKTFRSVLETRDKTEAPVSWAGTQNNLGSALFLLAVYSRDKTPLYDSVKAFQQALAIYEEWGAERMAAVASKNLKRAQSRLDRLIPPIEMEAEFKSTPELIKFDRKMLDRESGS